MIADLGNGDEVKFQQGTDVLFRLRCSEASKKLRKSPFFASFVRFLSVNFSPSTVPIDTTLVSSCLWCHNAAGMVERKLAGLFEVLTRNRHSSENGVSGNFLHKMTERITPKLTPQANQGQRFAPLVVA